MYTKNFFLSLFICLPSFISAQVGINTTKPRASLDVNGDMQIRGELRVGTDTDPNVAAGKIGQVLTSQGPSSAPKWTDFKLTPVFNSDYTLVDAQIKTDRVGLVLNTDYDNVTTTNEVLNSSWTVIEGLTTDISVQNKINEIIYTLQTVVQSSNGDATRAGYDKSINFACGVFIGKKGADRSTFTLTSQRKGIIQGNHYPQYPLILVSSSENLEVGEYQLLFAFQRRGGTTALTSLPLYVGRGFDTNSSYNVSNNFMNESLVRVDIFEYNK